MATRRAPARSGQPRRQRHSTPGNVRADQRHRQSNLKPLTNGCSAGSTLSVLIGARRNVLNSASNQNQAINALRPYSVYNLPDPPIPVLTAGSPTAETPARSPSTTTIRRCGVWSPRNIKRGPTRSLQHRRDHLHQAAVEPVVRDHVVAVTKNHRWVDAIADSPNDDYFPLDETWEWRPSFAGAYDVVRIEVSTLYDAFDGLPGQRTYLFRCGRSGRRSGAPHPAPYNLRVEPLRRARGTAAAQPEPAWRRRISAWRCNSQSVRLEVDLLNPSIPTCLGRRHRRRHGRQSSAGINYVSGPTFGYVTRIVSPRYLRFGATLKF